MLNISVVDIVGKHALSMKQGDCIFPLLHEQFMQNKPVTLDFSGVCVCGSSFFNAAIGALLNNLSLEDLTRLLTIEGLHENHRNRLNYVIENALTHYKESIKHG